MFQTTNQSFFLSNKNSGWDQSCSNDLHLSDFCPSVELQACQADSFIGQLTEGESGLRVAHVHHDPRSAMDSSTKNSNGSMMTGVPQK